MWSRDLNMGFLLDDGLFKAMKLIKNADPDKNGSEVMVLDLIHVYNFLL